MTEAELVCAFNQAAFRAQRGHMMLFAVHRADAVQPYSFELRDQNDGNRLIAVGWEVRAMALTIENRLEAMGRA